MAIKNDCSSGFDGIPVRYLKPVVDHLASPLSYIINNAIDKNIFPEQWKIARICPIPKVNEPTKIEEYRPISVLPVLSKVYERVILKQLCCYIEKNHLYNDNQSGFRRGHSTLSLLLKFRDDIKLAMNRSEVTLAVLIDYSKAFDTIEHETLLKKLHYLNFSANSLRLMHSYLSCRLQYTQVDDKNSSTSTVSFGVPQGSILGPVLFNLYVADLSKHISCNSIQYADDTNLYKSCKVKDLTSCKENIITDLCILNEWSTRQNLIFNEQKTKCMLFATQQMRRRHKLNNQTSLIVYNGSGIEQAKSSKLLGVYFDEHLSWNEHICQLTKSCSLTLRVLKEFGRFTPFKVRKTLAESLILSKISYCNVVLHQLPQYLLKRLQKIQNATAAYVRKQYTKQHQVIDLNWLPVKETMLFNTVKLVHKVLNDPHCPKYLKLELECKRRETRADCTMKIKRDFSGTFKEQALAFNDLPKDIRCSKNFSSFVRKCRRFYKDLALSRCIQ